MKFNVKETDDTFTIVTEDNAAALTTAGIFFICLISAIIGLFMYAPAREDPLAAFLVMGMLVLTIVLLLFSVSRTTVRIVRNGLIKISRKRLIFGGTSGEEYDISDVEAIDYVEQQNMGQNGWAIGATSTISLQLSSTRVYLASKPAKNTKSWKSELTGTLRDTARQLSVFTGLPVVDRTYHGPNRAS